jgi:hypothetical protein
MGKGGGDKGNGDKFDEVEFEEKSQNWFVW